MQGALQTGPGPSAVGGSCGPVTAGRARRKREAVALKGCDPCYACVLDPEARSPQFGAIAPDLGFIDSGEAGGDQLGGRRIVTSRRIQRRPE